MRLPAVILCLTLSAVAAAQPAPEPRQLAWQRLEMIAFVHFGMNTFTNREWGEGKEDTTLFDPSDLDARQWVAVLKDAGFKLVILTAKHHDGFCLWPSKFTEHSVKSSPWRGGKGDMVRELSEACRSAGLRFGVYLSPWDRHESSYGDSPRYNEHYRNQLTELLTGYGSVHEVWFDGACGEGPNGKKQEYDWPSFIAVVRKHAPDAVIFSDAGPDVRWVGNENGFAGETNWSMLRRDEFYPGTPNYQQLTDGHENGTHWVPAECDVSIRPGWFHHPEENEKIKSLRGLLDIYYGSVGRNGVLLLNVPPDRRGRIGDADAARLRELRRVLDDTFRTNLLSGKPARAGETDARAAVDGDWETSFAFAADVREGTIEIEIGRSIEFDRVMVQENIRTGQRISDFTVACRSDGSWRSIAAGTTVGYKRLLRIERSKGDALRLTVRSKSAAPAICEVGAFLAALEAEVK